MNIDDWLKKSENIRQSGTYAIWGIICFLGQYLEICEKNVFWNSDILVIVANCNYAFV